MPSKRTNWKRLATTLMASLQPRLFVQHGGGEDLAVAAGAMLRAPVTLEWWNGAEGWVTLHQGEGPHSLMHPGVQDEYGGEFNPALYRLTVTLPWGEVRTTEFAWRSEPVPQPELLLLRETDDRIRWHWAGAAPHNWKIERKVPPNDWIESLGFHPGAERVLDGIGERFVSWWRLQGRDVRGRFVTPQSNVVVLNPLPG